MADSQLRYPAEGGFYRTVVGYDLTLTEQADVGKAVSMVRLAMTPAPRDVIARELVRLRVLTKAKERDAIDTELEAQVWLDELSRYPGDVVVETLREWPRRQAGMWWPSWHELERILIRKQAPRAALLCALQRADRSAA